MQQMSSAAGQPPRRLTAYSEPARQKPRKADPAPSRWSYRLQRLMLTPMFRFCLRAVLPMAVTAGLGYAYMSDQGRRDVLYGTVLDMREAIETRPEFMVQMMSIDGASDELATAIHEIVPVTFPITSFDLDLPALRKVVMSLNPVRDADIRIAQGGVLAVTVQERQTSVLWKTRDGLFRLDDGGTYIGLALSADDYPKLPLIAGDGADSAVPEARALMAAAAPLGDRVQGFLRMGERRWDVVLDRGQRILLPETGAVQALERVIALNEVQDMLARDLALVDVRLGHRPTLRLNENAMAELWRIKTTALAEGATKAADKR